ncbi:HXXEE domain-containing protein [Mesorhizobium sp. BR1-1-16]|uniref:HXXEE domain-containing protein n=1 Tax=Mesorhizobium sp. BR1-1-16 TaxID=2876653 RepID=UPI001CCAAA85|nr:HXXEE domain-containing protein [Mesorhizobium sp. BR1-1-16]MBZ9936566.1 HXXEE domain-containing protein [Mesorhizobium sp. BR1-1-16]
MLSRLMTNWVYGGFLAAFLILALIGVVGRDLPAALVLIALQLPIYMLHEYEEHDDDRFRRFFNALIGGGRELLTVPAVFIINIGGVWLTYLAAIVLAATVDLGFGLIAIYGTLVNAVVHLGAAAAKRSYNPGLATAVILFLPAGIAGLWLVSAAGTTLGFHMLGLTVSIGLHAVIIAYVLVRRRRLAVP